MTVVDAWVTKFERTWLEGGAACRELDSKLASLIGANRNLGTGAAPSTVLALRCENSSIALRQLGMTPSSTIHCTALVALLGELLLCAEEGGILRKETVKRFAGSEPERLAVGEAMRLLRNAVCHPASSKEDGDEQTGIASFADFVAANFKEETWAPQLRQQPGDLGKREVAFFGLRLLDDIGWEKADHWRLKMKGVKRHR